MTTYIEIAILGMLLGALVTTIFFLRKLEDKDRAHEAKLAAERSRWHSMGWAEDVKHQKQEPYPR